MAVLTKVEVQTALAPYHALIRGVIDEAWREWRKVCVLRGDAEMAPLLYSRTVANYVFDAIARRAIPAFGTLDGARIIIEAQTFKVLVGGVILRFKKGGDDKLGCNIPTQSAMAFMEADGVLPGMPPECGKVEVIWQPNDIATSVERVLVVARDGDRLLWDYEIAPAYSTEVVAFPITAHDPLSEDSGDLIKPKIRPASASKTQ